MAQLVRASHRYHEVMGSNPVYGIAKFATNCEDHSFTLFVSVSAQFSVQVNLNPNKVILPKLLTKHFENGIKIQSNINILDRLFVSLKSFLLLDFNTLSKFNQKVFLFLLFFKVFEIQAFINNLLAV